MTDDPAKNVTEIIKEEQDKNSPKSAHPGFDQIYVGKDSTNKIAAKCKYFSLSLSGSLLRLEVIGDDRTEINSSEFLAFMLEVKKTTDSQLVGIGDAIRNNQVRHLNIVLTTSSSVTDVQILQAQLCNNTNISIYGDSKRNIHLVNDFFVANDVYDDADVRVETPLNSLKIGSKNLYVPVGLKSVILNDDINSLRMEMPCSEQIEYRGVPQHFIDNFNQGKYYWKGDLNVLTPLEKDTFIGSNDALDSVGNCRLLITNNAKLDFYASAGLDYIDIKGTGTTKFLKGNKVWYDITGLDITQKEVSFSEANIFMNSRLASVILRGETKCTEIAAGAFYNCHLTSANEINRLISGIEEIGKNTFISNDIKGEISSETVKKLDDMAFSYNDITSIDFPELENAGMGVFESNLLTSLDIPKVLPKLQEIRYSTFKNNTLVDVVLPNSSVKIIEGSDENCAFSENSDTLKKVTVPYERLASGEISSITGFSDAELKAIKNLVVTDGETIDKAGIVSKLTSLSKLVLPQTKVIGSNTFSNIPTLVSLEAPNVEEIQNNAFSNDGLKSGFLNGVMEFPKLVKIGSSAFENNSISKLLAPNLESMGSAALASNVLTEAKFDKLNDCTGKDQFANNKIANYSFKNLEVIPEGFMYNNSLTSVDLLNDFPKLKKVGRWAFAKNLNLTKVVLPQESVEVSLVKGEGIFNDATGITEVITPFDRFGNDDAKGSFETYIPHSLKSVSTLTIKGKEAITRENIAAELPNLYKLQLPESVEIGNRAFMNLSNLAEIKAPNAEIIGESAFSGANLSSEVRTNGKYEHEEFENTLGLYLPKAKQIKESAFADANHNLHGLGILAADQGLDFPNLESVENNAFSGWNLGVIRAPKLKTFTSEAFSYTEGLGLLLVSKENAKTISDCIHYHINAIALSNSELLSGKIDDQWTEKGMHYDILGNFSMNTDGDYENLKGYYWYSNNLEIKQGNKNIAIDDGKGNIKLENLTQGNYELSISLTNRVNESATISLGKFTLNEGAQPLVQAADLGNQQWLIDAVNKSLGKTVGKDVTFDDLETITSLEGQIVVSKDSIIPKEIELLSSLNRFSFSFNSDDLNGTSIGGEIPLEFWNLPLKEAKIYGGNFVGVIPQEIISKSDLNLSIHGTQLTANQKDAPAQTNKKFQSNFVPSAKTGLVLSGNSKIKLSDDNSQIRPFLSTDETSFGLTAFGGLASANESLFDGHSYKIVDTSDNSVVYEGEWDTSVSFEGKDTTYKVILDGAELNPNNVFEVKAEKLSNAVHSEFKLGYWRDYGFVLEGSASQDNKTYAQKDVTKKIEVVDATGKVVESFDAANTNWYDSKNYTGYQSILKKSQLKSIAAGSYKIQVHVTTADNDYTLPVSEPSIATRSYIGDYQKQIDQIPTDTADQMEISFQSVSGQMQMTIAKAENVINQISNYSKGGNKVLDAWIATDAFDFQQDHTKEVVIEGADGKEVRRKVIATWDITKTFGLSVKNEWKKSGFQLSLSSTDQKAGNKIFVVVKDKDGNEKLKVEIK